MRGVKNHYNFDDLSGRLATRRTSPGFIHNEQSSRQFVGHNTHFVHYDYEGDCYHPAELNLHYHLPPLVQLPFDQDNSNRFQLPTTTVLPRTTSENEYYLVVNNDRAKYKVGQVSPKGIAIRSIDSPCDKRKRHSGEWFLLKCTREVYKRLFFSWAVRFHKT